MTRKEFQEKVIDTSYHNPVLVDFWAPWCGPCRVLTPVLEGLAAKADNWTLVKVNTEESQELATEYRIMSIPNVKLFSEGQVLDEFAGALPAAQIQTWLDRTIPDKSVKDLKDILQEAASVFDPIIAAKLVAFAETHPGNTKARFYVARHQVIDEPEIALNWLDEIHMGDEYYDKAEDLRELARFMTATFPDKEMVPRLLEKARQFIKRGEIELAIQTLIDVTAADKTIMNDMPRKTTIGLFHILGNEHDLTRKYRRKFDMVLY